MGGRGGAGRISAAVVSLQRVAAVLRIANFTSTLTNAAGTLHRGGVAWGDYTRKPRSEDTKGERIPKLATWRGSETGTTTNSINEITLGTHAKDETNEGPLLRTKKPLKEKTEKGKKKQELDHNRQQFLLHNTMPSHGLLATSSPTVLSK